MAITGGFGVTIDTKTGRSRRWVMDRKGVKRWADTHEAVTPRTTLPNDVARCAGVGDDVNGWREGCETCLRRTDPGYGERVVHMAPPPIIVFECEALIEP